MIDKDEIQLEKDKEYCVVILCKFADIEFISKFKGIYVDRIEFENPTRIYLEKFISIEELNTLCSTESFKNLKYKLKGKKAVVMIYED